VLPDGGACAIVQCNGVECPVSSVDIVLEILCGNLRSLNYPAKRSAIREFVSSIRVNIIFF
jgi:hypothetical protein